MLAQQILQKKGGPAPAPPRRPPRRGRPTGGRRTSRRRPRLETRAEIYARVSEAAAKLQQLEPHSPIPYLLNRAVELGSLPFPELMKSLILNADVLQGSTASWGSRKARGMTSTPSS